MEYLAIQRFLEDHPGLNLEKTYRVLENPYMEDGGSNMNHYGMLLSITGQGPKRTFHSFFSVGSGWTRRPSILDLLECILSDALGYDSSGSFEDWALDYGYDPDSRKALKIYETVGEQTRKLKEFLGDWYEEAINLE